MPLKRTRQSQNSTGKEGRPGSEEGRDDKVPRHDDKGGAEDRKCPPHFFIREFPPGPRDNGQWDYICIWCGRSWESRDRLPLDS